jgi:hypothetical protein
MASYTRLVLMGLLSFFPPLTYDNNVQYMYDGTDFLFFDEARTSKCRNAHSLLNRFLYPYKNGFFCFSFLFLSTAYMDGWSRLQLALVSGLELIILLKLGVL